MTFNILQRGFSDCGPACLASVAAFYGLFISVSEIRKHAGTNKRGTTIKGLIFAAEKFGFEARGVKGSLESLNSISKPVIAHLRLKNSLCHFVTIINSNDSEIMIMDPALGKTIAVGYSDFMKKWTGILVLIKPNSKFNSLQIGQSAENPKKRQIYQLTVLVVLIFLLLLISYILVRLVRNFLSAW